MVLLSITPLLDGVLRLDIIAPFHTSGPPLLQFHLAIEQWGYYTAAVGAIYTDVTTPVSFSRCFFAASIDILLAASTTWPGTTQTVWNINASTANKLRFIWAKAPIELDGAVWFGIFI